MDTIKSSSSLSHLFSSGRRIHTPYVTFILEKRNLEPSISGAMAEHDRSGRVAFIAGKRIGNAVLRNRAKRRLRALCQALEGPWAGYDVIFLAKGSLITARYSKVLQACQKALDHSPLMGERSSNEQGF